MTTIKYCKKCLMPNTRPGSIFDEKGICQACLNFENRKKIDWKQRKRELRKLCQKHKRSDGYYDCMIPVSGGKDSHFQVYTMVEEMGMHPLLFTVGDPFTKTQAGIHNFFNMGKTWGCDQMIFYWNPPLLKKVIRIGFEELGEPLRFIEKGIHSIVMKTAMRMGISLVVYGENAAFEYGATKNPSYSGKDYIEDIFKELNLKFWAKRGIPMEELDAAIPPKEPKENWPEIIFMSQYDPWSSVKHLEVARKRGFHDLTHEWKREGTIEDFEQIDSVAYMVNFYLKYPKFGFQRVTDIASRRVREGLMTLEQAKRLIAKHDHKTDQKAIDDFLAFTGHTDKEFWDIYEKFYNRNIFEKVDGRWRLKDTGKKQTDKNSAQ